MDRQEAEYKRVLEDMVMDDRVQKVQELKQKFAAKRMIGEVTKLEELMHSLDISRSREEEAGSKSNTRMIWTGVASSLVSMESWTSGIWSWK